MSHEDDPVTQHRGDIDRIDRVITALLGERMRIGRELGNIKRARQEPARSPEREAEVIARVRAAAHEPLSPASAERIFAAIIEETSSCQQAGLRAEADGVPRVLAPPKPWRRRERVRGSAGTKSPGSEADV